MGLPLAMDHRNVRLTFFVTDDELRALERAGVDTSDAGLKRWADTLINSTLADLVAEMEADE